MTQTLSPTQPDTHGSQALQLFNEMDRNVEYLLSIIPALLDDELKLLLQVSEQAQKQSWVVRGAAAAEVIKRVDERKLDRQTRKATLADIAREAGCSVATIEDDARTVKTFGVEALRGDTAPEREFWRRASGQKDPQAAMELVFSKRDRNEPYPVSAFEADLVDMNGGAKSEELEDRIRISRLLQTDTSAKLRKYLMQSGQPLGEVVDAMAADFLKGV